MTDQKIIALIRQGKSQAAMQELYKHLNVFVSYAYKNYRIEEKAEAVEVFHEALITFIAKVERKENLVLTSTLKTYIFAIARNKLLAERRRTNILLDSAASAALLVNVPTEEAADEEEKGRRMQALEEALTEIGSEQAKIIQMFYLQRKSIAEITKILGYQNERVVSNLKCRALKRLRNKLFGSLYVLLLLVA